MAGPGEWDSPALHEVAAMMEGFPAPWWIAGGWAIDLFVGRQTRSHGDVDLGLLRADQPALAAHFAGWDTQVVADGALTPWTPGDWLEGGRRWQFWARPQPERPWSLEFLLEEGDRAAWAYRRDPRITLPLARYVRRSAEALPFVTPEAALLFKSNRAEEPKNVADFETVAPLVDAEGQMWLADALRLVAPGHPWIARL